MRKLRAIRVGSLVVLLVLACPTSGCESDISSEAPQPEDSDPHASPDPAEDSTADETGEDTDDDTSDTTAQNDEDGESTDTATEEDATADEDGGSDDEVVRFIVMGDTGEGSDAQRQVAAGAQSRCDRAGGCHGLLITGDLIYDNGPESAESPELTNKVDKPYRQLKYGPPPAEGETDERRRMPVYASMGNHDIGHEELRNLPVKDEKYDYYLEYARNNDWFVLPSVVWDRKVEFVHLMAANTNPFVYLGEPKEKHNEMIDGVVGQTDATWTVMFGHHTYRSDGEHGNAGAYEIPFDVSDLNLELFGIELSDAKLSGGVFRDWFNDNVCGRVDFYLAGHEHNLQWIGPKSKLGDSDGTCETYLGVSGAGAKHDPVVDKGNNPEFAKGGTRGFQFFEFRRDRVDVEVCDKEGQTLWSKTITR